MAGALTIPKPPKSTKVLTAVVYRGSARGPQRRCLPPGPPQQVCAQIGPSRFACNHARCQPCCNNDRAD